MATYYDSDFVAQRQTNRVQDWANLVLAIWFFISPWVLQFGAGSNAAAAGATSGMAGTAAWDAWVLSVLVFLVALSAIRRMEMWQEWFTVIFGAWIFVAPWVLGFSALGAASWDHWFVGALVFLIALWSMGTAQTAPARTATRPTTTTPPPSNEPLP